MVVPKKGPKKYRFCVNFQPLNEIIIKDPDLELRFNGDTAEAIIKQGGEARYIFKIDNKEAHNTLVLEDQCRALFGIITPFGIYRSIRGQFGVANVAKTYIKAMMMSIGHLRERGVYFLCRRYSDFCKQL